jgi:hypothetical protein
MIVSLNAMHDEQDPEHLTVGETVWLSLSRRGRQHLIEYFSERRDGDEAPDGAYSQLVPYEVFSQWEEDCRPSFLRQKLGTLVIHPAGAYAAAIHLGPIHSLTWLAWTHVALPEAVNKALAENRR